MSITMNITPTRVLGKRSPMLYGQFIEHFHRQIYDPGNVLSDEDGFRTDIIDAMKKIRVPILRWPGGCFVSSLRGNDGFTGAALCKHTENSISFFILPNKLSRYLR